MDGKIFKLSDMKIGTNAPPLHPHCRSCTAPYFEDAEDLERTARSEEGKTYKVLADMSYKEWKEKYVPNSSEKSVQQGNKNVIIKPKNILPNADRVIIPKEKFTEYALNKEHPKGKDKALVFESALGFVKDNADELIQVIREKVSLFEAIKAQPDKYGDRYKVYIDVKGPNGNTATVLTAWIVAKGETRLTSAYVKDRPKK